MTFRIGGLFEGYGGLTMGVQLALGGGELAWYSEYEPATEKDPNPKQAPARLLAYRHPGVPNLGDITAVDWSTVEPVDVICGGSPCQDVSTAGRRGGMRPGTRSGLWESMRDAIAVLRPRLVVWENVRGVTSACAHSELAECPRCVGGSGPHAPVLRALGRVLGDLADLGFDAEWHGLRASDVGAPHERFRVFVVAYPSGQPWRLEHGDDGCAGVGSRLISDGRALLPTPTANLGRGTGTPSQATAEARYDKGKRCLDDALALLPTPTSRDSKGANQRGDETCLHGALLPTPSVADATGGHKHRSGDRSGELLRPGLVLTLLPTPRATDGTKGGPNQRGSSGDLMLPSAVQELLPTPTATPYGSNQSASDGAAVRPSLDGIVEWGKYELAIRRWGAVLGRPAPDPTEPNRKGGRRLAPVFGEWMMGIPAGHVTDPAIGLTRNEQLKLIGNGVVPQQSAAGIRVCLARAAALDGAA